MSWASARLEKPWHSSGTDEVHEKWGRIAPTVVKESVSFFSGSRNAGRVAGGATRVAVESSPKARRIVGEATREVAYETGSTLIAAALIPVIMVALPTALIHDAFTADKKKRWVFGT